MPGEKLSKGEPQILLLGVRMPQGVENHQNYREKGVFNVEE